MGSFGGVVNIINEWEHVYGLLAVESVLNNVINDTCEWVSMHACQMQSYSYSNLS